MIAVKVGNCVPDVRNGEVNFPAVFVTANDTAAGLDGFTGGEFIQRDLAEQVDIALAKGIIGQQPDADNISHHMPLKGLLEFRKQNTGPVQVGDRCFPGIAYDNPLAVCQRILNGYDLVSGNISCTHGKPVGWKNEFGCPV